MSNGNLSLAMDELDIDEFTFQLSKWIESKITSK